MIYIPFPRQDLNQDTDLVNWRAKTSWAEGDWRALRAFLHRQTLLPLSSNEDAECYKCWYSECMQLDSNALDLEHFRPKGSARPLTLAHRRTIQREFGIPASNFPQLEDAATNPHYDWLRFDYRNYRLVSAITNRSGAKHIYFPILRGSTRLQAGQLPYGSNAQREYNLFLDPTNAHDARLLRVLANGRIQPNIPLYLPTEEDCANPAQNWANFDYLRAALSIVLFRLNHGSFVAARANVYRDTCSQIILFSLALNNPEAIPAHVAVLTRLILPSSPFSLTARSAMLNFEHPQGTANRAAASEAIRQLLAQAIIGPVDQHLAQLVQSWDNP